MLLDAVSKYMLLNAIRLENIILKETRFVIMIRDYI